MIKTGIALIDHALRLNANLAVAWHLAHSATAFGYFLRRDLDEASAWAEHALHLRLDWPPALRVLAMSHALAGRKRAAGEAMSRLRLIQPGLRVSNLHEQIFLHRPEHMAKYVEAMRRAGLPE